MTEAIYLYGFVPADAPLPERGLEGIAGTAVELLPLSDFSAAIARVPAAEYTPDTIEKRLTDLRWVSEQGVQHERVVAWFVDHSTILPVRLLTLYSSAEALRAEASARADTVLEQMRRFAGTHEWDVKVSFRSETLKQRLNEVSAEVAVLDEEIASASPGKRYLLQKKRGDLVAVETARVARRLASDLLDALMVHAERTVMVPIPRDVVDLPVVLNAALLVRVEAEPGFRETARAEAERLAGFGIEVMFTGPWAPYRFMASADDGDRAEHPADA